jgi:hypothetical protein
MTVRINTAARSAMATALLGVIDGGASASKIRIYSGSQPATPATAPSGTLLLEFTLSDPSFVEASGVLTADITPALTATGLADATAGWARILTSTEAGATGLGVVDGAVGTDVVLSTAAITTGLSVTLTAVTLTVPAS